MRERAKCGKVGEHRGVYWLPCSVTEPSDGAPLCPNPKAAWLALRRRQSQCQIRMPRRCSWKRARKRGDPKHRALPHHVSKEEHDAHQFTHLAFRSCCNHCVKGKAVDDAHRPRVDPHRGEAKMGMDYFFLARATEPQRAKAVLNCLDLQSGAVFSAVVVKGGDPNRWQWRLRRSSSQAGLG